MVGFVIQVVIAILFFIALLPAFYAALPQIDILHIFHGFIEALLKSIGLG